MSDKKPIILYVDDDPDYREVMRVILVARGYSLSEARCSERGLRVH